MGISDLTDLANTLNHWLDELNQQGILVEYKQPEERNLYLFEVSTSLRLSSSTFLRKKTTQPDVFVKLFGEMRGIQTGSENDFFILRELESGSFRELNRNFVNFSQLFKNKIARQLTNKVSQSAITCALEDLKKESNNSLTQLTFNFSSQLDLDNFANTLTSKKIIFLSLQSCQLGKLTADRFQAILKILKGLDFEKIDLSKNQLNSLTRPLLDSLFSTLTKSGIKEINLDENNLNISVNENSDLLINFLQKCSLERLSLKDNNLNDTIATIFATHSRIKNLEFASNKISDGGASQFVENYYLTDINLSFNDVSKNTFVRIKEKAILNQKALKAFAEKDFIEKVIIIAQGRRNKDHDFHKLPLEIIIVILAQVGSGLRRIDSVIQLCKLIIDNICSSPKEKLNWKKKFPAEKPIFCDLSYARHFFHYHKAQGDDMKAEKYGAILLQKQLR